MARGVIVNDYYFGISTLSGGIGQQLSNQFSRIFPQPVVHNDNR
jgi:hypothetical protein